MTYTIKKGTQVLWQQTIENGNTAGFSYDLSLSVALGDQINFLITGRSNSFNDSTAFDPTISFTGNASASLS